MPNNAGLGADLCWRAARLAIYFFDDDDVFNFAFAIYVELQWQLWCPVRRVILAVAALEGFSIFLAKIPMN